MAPPNFDAGTATAYPYGECGHMSFAISIPFQLCFAFKGHIDDQLNIVIQYTNNKYQQKEEGEWFQAHELSPYNGYVCTLTTTNISLALRACGTPYLGRREGIK